MAVYTSVTLEGSRTVTSEATSENAGFSSEKGRMLATPRSARAFSARTGSSAESESSDLPDGHLVHSPFPDDMWGMTMLAVVEDGAEILAGEATLVHVMRFSFTCMCSALNVFLQFIILYYVDVFVVESSVKQLQNDYRMFHEQVFDAAGQFQQAAWDAWQLRDSLCGAAMNKTVFAAIVIFLWLAKILGEIRQCDRLRRNIDKLPTLPRKYTPQEMLNGELLGDGDLELMVLSPVARGLLYVLVIIPRYTIAVYLLALGCRWLCAAQNFSDLILNSLALAFVTDIDNIILSNFFPSLATETLHRCKFAFELNDEDATEDAQRKQIVSMYTRSIFWAFAALALPVLYLRFFQGVIPGYQFDVRSHCLASAEKKNDEQQLCRWYDHSCFPYGPQPSPSPRRLAGCAGGGLEACVDLCYRRLMEVSGPAFAACVKSCNRRCTV